MFRFIVKAFLGFCGVFAVYLAGILHDRTYPSFNFLLFVGVMLLLFALYGQKASVKHE